MALCLLETKSYIRYDAHSSSPSPAIGKSLSPLSSLTSLKYNLPISTNPNLFPIARVAPLVKTLLRTGNPFARRNCISRVYISVPSPWLRYLGATEDIRISAKKSHPKSRRKVSSLFSLRRVIQPIIFFVFTEGTEGITPRPGSLLSSISWIPANCQINLIYV